MNKVFTVTPEIPSFTAAEDWLCVWLCMLCHLAATSHWKLGLWNFLCSNRNFGDAVTGDMARWVCELQGHAFLSLCVVSMVDEVCPRFAPVKLVAKPGSSGPCLSFQTSLFSPLCSVMGRVLQPIAAAAGKTLHCLGGVSCTSFFI